MFAETGGSAELRQPPCQAAPSYPTPLPPPLPPTRREAGWPSATADLDSHPGPANWDQASVFTSRPQFALLLSGVIAVAASQGWSEGSGETSVKCLVQNGSSGRSGNESPHHLSPLASGFIDVR